MFIKAFQVVLVTLLVIFTTGGAILLMIGLWTLLLPSNGGSFSFGFRLGLLEIVAIIMLLIVAGVFLFTRRHHFK